jgi:hypothetical protein
MSSYCDTCDNTMRETTAYLVSGQRFNYCGECVNEDGAQGESIPTIREELEWCEIELANIKGGLFSMYTQDYIEGAISALRLAKEGASR